MALLGMRKGDGSFDSSDCFCRQRKLSFCAPDTLSRDFAVGLKGGKYEMNRVNIVPW